MEASDKLWLYQQYYNLPESSFVQAKAVYKLLTASMLKFRTVLFWGERH